PRFLQAQRSTLVADISFSVVSQSEFFRVNDDECLRDKDFDHDDPTRNDPYRPTWEALSKKSTELLLKTLEPRAVFNGHTHRGCKKSRGIRNIPEKSNSRWAWEVDGRNLIFFILLLIAFGERPLVRVDTSCIFLGVHCQFVLMAQRRQAKFPFGNGFRETCEFSTVIRGFKCSTRCLQVLVDVCHLPHESTVLRLYIVVAIILAAWLLRSLVPIVKSLFLRTRRIRYRSPSGEKLIKSG
ncbi:hypothetical protein ANCCAN_04988, partial [Ancylostoma caninum]